jgi:predicted nucleotidyltransferase
MHHVFRNATEDQDMTIIESLKPHFATFDLTHHALGIGVVGSDSHGTKIPPQGGGIDDTDYMGIVLPSVQHMLGLGTWEHWVYGPDAEGLDVTLYSLRKFIGLLLKSNPNVIGFLWLRPGFYVHRTPELDQLIAERDAFSSLHAYPAFIGYAHAQLKKMGANVFNGYMGAKRKAIVEKFGYDTKNASHLVRLLRTGIEYLETGQVNVFREHDAEELMAIKRGEWTLERVKGESTRLFAKAEAAKDASKLPKEPDYARAERLLIELSLQSLARQTMPFRFVGASVEASGVELARTVKGMTVHESSTLISWSVPGSILPMTPKGEGD